jgi:hypothetical protein
MSNQESQRFLDTEGTMGTRGEAGLQGLKGEPGTMGTRGEPGTRGEVGSTLNKRTIRHNLYIGLNSPVEAEEIIFISTLHKRTIRHNLYFKFVYGIIILVFILVTWITWIYLY